MLSVWAAPGYCSRCVSAGGGARVRSIDVAQGAAECEVCGSDGAEMSADGHWRCLNCAAQTDDDDLPLLVEGMLVASSEGAPAIIVEDETWSWSELGDALAETLAGGRSMELHLCAKSGDRSDALSADPATAATATPLPRRETDEDSQRAEAVALLADCLPLRTRQPCPDDQLAKAVAFMRTHLHRPELPWTAIAAATGWDGPPPDEDREFWLDAAFSLAAPRRPLPLPDELQECLASLELDDWLSTVIELTRAGAGTPVDPQSLLVLSSRCMDVDSGAVEPESAGLMEAAFEVIVPVWQAVGAVADDATLTELGAWGLPLALARAWDGELEDGREPRPVD